MAAEHAPAIIDEWLRDLKNNVQSNLRDDPYYWASNPEILITSSQPITFDLGTGAQILSSTLSKCASTNHELIIVTCFWAESSSQEAISSLLLKLSAKSLAQNRKIRVRICFSSRSIFQKLFQTSSLDGKLYPPSTWASLGLPTPEEITGLEMVVKSVFVFPFSVMHPKFILMDRKVAFMPSCNVSWENWFEGCIEMRGDIAGKLFDFWSKFWSRGEGSFPELLPTDIETSNGTREPSTIPPLSIIKHTNFSPEISPPQTILLPSPHHFNPHFRVFLSTPTPPPTPLNLFLLQIFTQAKQTIFIQTPNITSFPVLSALLAAVKRGVDIHLITSSRLMILEQLVTAGTITEFEMWKLRRKHQNLTRSRDNADPELALGKLGGLRIGYYHARGAVTGDEEPVKSHLKLVIVDDEVTVLGSGNMDRASWYTSQELGVAIFSKEVAREIRGSVGKALEGRVGYVY